MFYIAIPNPNYLLYLLHMIAVARERRFYEYEEYCYCRLVYLMRQGDMLIKVTRTPEIRLLVKRLEQQQKYLEDERHKSSQYSLSDVD